MMDSKLCRIAFGFAGCALLAGCMGSAEDVAASQEGLQVARTVDGHRDIFIGTPIDAFPPGSPEAAQVYVERITAGGTGCPGGTDPVNGTMRYDLSDSRDAFTMIFDQYVAEAGPGISFREGRKTCTINLDLHMPQGWSYSIASVDYRGFAELEDGVRGEQAATYYFQGERLQARVSTPVVGPYYDNYLVSDRVGFESTVWSPCGDTRSANIITELRIDRRSNRRGYGLMTVDTVDGTVETKLHFQFRRCDLPPGI